jgi:DNA-directed RNA polymerase subunit RPC12/RpoP
MDYYCDFCQETVKTSRALINRDYVHCPACGSVLRPLNEGRDKTLRDMTLFDLSVIGVMPRDVFAEIEDRLNLALTYLEAGDPDTAKDILWNFLNRGGK